MTGEIKAPKARTQHIIPEFSEFFTFYNLKEFGIDFLKEYRDRARLEYSSSPILGGLSSLDKIIEDDFENLIQLESDINPFLSVLHIDNKPVAHIAGSNPFSCILVNEIIRELGVEIVSFSEIERILQSDSYLQSYIGGINYIDAALILGMDPSEIKRGPNRYHTLKLFRQIRQRKGKKFKLPVILSLSDLNLKKDERSPQGLSFELSESAKIIYEHPLLEEKWQGVHRLYLATSHIYNKHGYELSLGPPPPQLAYIPDLTYSNSRGKIFLVGKTSLEKIDGDEIRGVIESYLNDRRGRKMKYWGTAEERKEAEKALVG